MARVTNLKPLSLLPDSAIFLIGSVLVYGVVCWSVPALTAFGIESMLDCCDLAGGKQGSGDEHASLLGKQPRKHSADLGSTKELVMDIEQ